MTNRDHRPDRPRARHTAAILALTLKGDSIMFDINRQKNCSEPARLSGKKFLLTALLSFAVLTLLRGSSFAQSGTLTDDAYTSRNASVQVGNLNGKGPTIIVSGSGAAISGRPAGPADGYVKFKLTPSLPAGTTADDVAKATL